MDNVIGQIDRALDMTGAIVIAAVDGDRLTAPTPCQDWDVHTVLNHAVGNMHRFAAEVSGTDAGAGREDDWLGIDPQAAFAAAAEVDRAACHRPDALTGTVHMALGELPGPAAAVVHLTEVVAHGVDIAVAIDRPDLADDELCAELLTTVHAMGGLDGFGESGMFGAEVTVSADEPAHRRLLSYLGRAW